VAPSFSENMAAVRIEGKFGFIDRAGSVIIPPKFDLSGPMSVATRKFLWATASASSQDW
jgi:hypothetical protein